MVKKPNLAKNESNSRIQETDEFFTKAIDLIPIESWGFDAEILDRLKQRKHDLVNSKLGRAKAGKVSKKDKQRLSRADTEQINTVSQVWKFLESEGTSTAPKAQLPATKPAQKRNKSPATVSGVVSTREEALARLQAKLADLKRVRGKSAEEMREGTRLKRRASKLKMKERKKNEKAANLNKKPKLDLAAAENGTKEGKESSKGKGEIRNQEGKVVYNRFDFALSSTARAIVKQQENKEQEKQKKKGRRSKNQQKSVELRGRDHRTLINKVNARQNKIDRLKEKDPEKAEKLQKNIKWDSAMQKAQGHLVKDDPELLKKSLKRKEKKKDHSNKKWKHRIDTVEKKQQRKQEKRTHNIKKRTDAKKDKKLKQARKRGRLV